MTKKRTNGGYKKHRRFDVISFDPKAGARTNTSRARQNTSTGLTEYGGTWSAREASHLLKRALFGAKQDEVNELLELSPAGAVDLLVSEETLTGEPVNNYFDHVEDIPPNQPSDVPPGISWVDAPHIWGLEYHRNMSLKGWWLKNILNQGISIHQRMTLFWHAILPIQMFQIEFPGAAYRYLTLLHQYSLGNFKTLIRALTTDPAMLIYLNGYLNVKDAPDENYARELQELFTIGKGPNASFSESDVYEAARVLTGWTIDWDASEAGDPGSYFEEDDHDTGDKQFSSFYNNRIIAGRSGQGGREETDELIDMIFDNEETALYICRRLYNFFVYHLIDENAEENVIKPLAEQFRENNYEIAPVISSLLKSEHFFDTSNIGAYIKSPIDQLVGLARVAEVELPEDLTEDFEAMAELYWVTGDLGQEIGDPPNVSGWQAYYQQPSYDRIWINTDTITKRAQYQGYLIYDFIYLPDFVERLNKPEDPDRLIDDVAVLLHGIDLSGEVKAGMKAALLGGQSNDYYWTNAWLQYQNDPDNDEHRSIVENRLAQLFYPMLQLSEFQLF